MFIGLTRCICRSMLWFTCRYSYLTSLKYLISPSGHFQQVFFVPKSHISMLRISLSIHRFHCIKRMKKLNTSYFHQLTVFPNIFVKIILLPIIIKSNYKTKSPSKQFAKSFLLNNICISFIFLNYSISPRNRAFNCLLDIPFYWIHWV